MKGDDRQQLLAWHYLIWDHPTWGAENRYSREAICGCTPASADYPKRVQVDSWEWSKNQTKNFKCEIEKYSMNKWIKLWTSIGQATTYSHEHHKNVSWPNRY